MPSDSRRPRASPNQSASGGLGSERDEHEPGQRLDAERRQAHALAIERGEPARLRYAGQLAVLTVRPAVVGAAQHLGQRPVPDRICIARWRQTFESARSSPSSPRTMATGSPATLAVANEPGSATARSGQTKIHERANTWSSSASKTSRST